MRFPAHIRDLTPLQEAYQEALRAKKAAIIAKVREVQAWLRRGAEPPEAEPVESPQSDESYAAIGDIWEHNGNKFMLVRFCDGWDGPRGWECQRGWMGADCFPPKGNARLLSREPPKP